MKIKHWISYFAIILATVSGSIAIDTQKLNASPSSQQSEIPFEFLAISTTYPEIPESKLIGINLENNFLSLSFFQDLKYYTIELDFDEIDWSKHESIDDAILHYRSLLSLNQSEFLQKKLSEAGNTFAIIGDRNSIIAKLVQKIHESRERICNFTMNLENLNSLIYNYGGEAYTDPPGKEIFMMALQLKSILESYQIQEILFRSTEEEFPTSDDFFDWPDTITSLYFFAGGGFTVSPVTNQFPQKGYVVALDGFSHIISAADFFSGPSGEEAGRLIMKEYLAEHAKQFLKPHIFFGGWHDTERDLIFLDLSEVIQDLDEAIRIAKERDQIAIYDLSTGTVIQTHGTGGLSMKFFSKGIFTNRYQHILFAPVKL